MPSHTAYAAHAAEPAGAAAQYTSVAPALYRAALGAVNPDHYLFAFERLDSAGRVLPGWNLAAALCPPGWLLFRKLWRPALLLLLGLASAAALLWVAHFWLATPLPILAGVAIAGLLMLCGGFGLFGDALMHADVQRRIARAVSAAPTMREAMVTLQHEAVSRRWLLSVTGLGVVLMLAAIAAWLGVGSQWISKPARGAVVAAPVFKPEPAQEPALAQGPEASAAVPSPTADAEERSAPQESMQETLLEQEQQPQASPVPEPKPAQEPRQAQRPAPAVERPAVPAVQRRLYINVGLFADPENARRADARLRQAGLPSAVEPLVRADGSRLQRVRVGPFNSAAQANVAAARVRALGLEAVAAAQ